MPCWKEITQSLRETGGYEYLVVDDNRTYLPTLFAHTQLPEESHEQPEQRDLG